MDNIKKLFNTALTSNPEKSMEGRDRVVGGSLRTGSTVCPPIANVSSSVETPICRKHKRVLK